MIIQVSVLGRYLPLLCPSMFMVLRKVAGLRKSVHIWLLNHYIPGVDPHAVSTYLQPASIVVSHRLVAQCCPRNYLLCCSPCCSPPTVRPGPHFNPLALASHVRPHEWNNRTSYYGFSERYSGHPDFSAAHTHGVELADVIQTEIRRLCDLCSGYNVSDGLNFLSPTATS